MFRSVPKMEIKLNQNGAKMEPDSNSKPCLKLHPRKDNKNAPKWSQNGIKWTQNYAKMD